MLSMRAITIVCVAVLGYAIFATGHWWSRGIAFGEAPDEPEHYTMVEFVAKQGRLPHYGEPGFRVWLMKRGSHQFAADPTNLRGTYQLQMSGEGTELRQTYLFVPQLPYWLNGWFCRLQGGATPERARASTRCASLPRPYSYSWRASLCGRRDGRRRLRPAPVSGCGRNSASWVPTSTMMRSRSSRRADSSPHVLGASAARSQCGAR